MRHLGNIDLSKIKKRLSTYDTTYSVLRSGDIPDHWHLSPDVLSLKNNKPHHFCRLFLGTKRNSKRYIFVFISKKIEHL